MPEDFGDSFAVLGAYGWHSASDPGVSSPGTVPAMGVLTHGRGGSFGAYSFNPAAFEQAKRCWWIHGVMEAGSDILVPVNRNAEFRTPCDYGSFTTDAITIGGTMTIVTDSEVTTGAETATSDLRLPEAMAPPVVAEVVTAPSCPNLMGSPVGYRVAYISAYDSRGKHAPIRDATVIEMPKHADGSFTGELRLNKRAPGFAMTYDIAILPPDYVDMCNCTMGGTVTVTSDEAP